MRNLEYLADFFRKNFSFFCNFSKFATEDLKEDIIYLFLEVNDFIDKTPLKQTINNIRSTLK